MKDRGVNHFLGPRSNLCLFTDWFSLQILLVIPKDGHLLYSDQTTLKISGVAFCNSCIGNTLRFQCFDASLHSAVTRASATPLMPLSCLESDVGLAMTDDVLSRVKCSLTRFATDPPSLCLQ